MATNITKKLQIEARQKSHTIFEGFAEGNVFRNIGIFLFQTMYDLHLPQIDSQFSIELI